MTIKPSEQAHQYATARFIAQHGHEPRTMAEEAECYRLAQARTLIEQNEQAHGPATAAPRQRRKNREA